MKISLSVFAVLLALAAGACSQAEPTASAPTAASPPPAVAAAAETTASGSGSGATRTFPAGSLPLHWRNESGTIATLEGVDTAQARVTGRVTEADAREYCGRDPNGETTARGGTQTVEQCVANSVRQQGSAVQTATADCVQRTISPTSGGRYTLTGVAGSPPAPQFRDESTHQIIEGLPSGVDTVTREFEILCPTAARAWPASPQ